MSISFIKFLLKYITLELNQKNMKDTLITIILSLFLAMPLHAAGEKGGSGGSGGSGGNGGSGGSGGSSASGGSSSAGGGSGDYTNSSSFDDELRRITFEIEKVGNIEGALKDLEIYVYENPTNASGWNMIGFASRKLGKFEDAEIYYNTGLEIDPEHEGILAYQGELYLQTNRYNKALGNLDKLKDLCNFNCYEKVELAEAIATYELENNL